MGRPVSGADIFAAARALEAAYANAGYVLVRITLPPQKLVNGSKLRLVVVDGLSSASRSRMCRSGSASTWQASWLL